MHSGHRAADRFGNNTRAFDFSAGPLGRRVTGRTRARLQRRRVHGVVNCGQFRMARRLRVRLAELSLDEFANETDNVVRMTEYVPPDYNCFGIGYKTGPISKDPPNLKSDETFKVGSRIP